MVRVRFPQKPFMGQTYVGEDARLYKWTGAKWRFLFALGEVSAAASKVPPLQDVSDVGNDTTNVIKHAPAQEELDSVNLGQLQDGSLEIDIKEIYQSGEPALRLNRIFKNAFTGVLYNIPALLDARFISSSDYWTVPTLQQMIDLLDFIDPNKELIYDETDPENPVLTEIIYPDAGGMLKNFDKGDWAYPNVRATDNYELSVIGSGKRISTDLTHSEFTGLGKTAVFWTQTEEVGVGYWALEIDNTNSRAKLSIHNPANGYSVRFINANTTLNHLEKGIYTDNTGEEYLTICINGVEYMTRNLADTMFREPEVIEGEVTPDQDPITFVSDQEEWALNGTPVENGGLFVESACYYNNREASVGALQFSEIYNPHQPFINNVRWHPDGMIFSYIPGDTGNAVPSRVVHSQGSVFIHYWNRDTTHEVPEVPELPPVDDIDPTIGVPEFIPVDYYYQEPVVPEGEEPPVEVPPEIPLQRIMGKGRVRFQAECINAESVTYSIDQLSIDGGNTIDAVTGVVHFDELWLGDTIITATFTGVDGLGDLTEVTVDHTITSVESTEELPYFTLPAQTFETDPKPIHREWEIPYEIFDLESTEPHYIYAKLPLYTDKLANVVVTTEFFHETIFENHLLILMGICNSEEQGRALSMLWGNAGEVKIPSIPVPPKPSVQIRWVTISSTCLEDGNGDYTGQQEVEKKKQKYNTETEQWEDVGETTKDTVTNNTACPPPAPDPYRIATNVGQVWDETTAKEIAYSSGTVTVKTPTTDGYNYAFISYPTALGKPTIKNSINMDITSQFSNVGADTKNGFQDNTVWRKDSPHSTRKVTTYYVS